MVLPTHAAQKIGVCRCTSTTRMREFVAINVNILAVDADQGNTKLGGGNQSASTVFE